MTLRRIEANPIGGITATQEQLPNPPNAPEYVPAIWVDDADGSLYIGGRRVGSVLLNSASNQTITGGFNLINDTGAIVTTNTEATPADSDFGMFVDDTGRGWIYYRAGFSNIKFNAQGAIVFNPVSGNNDGGHGVIVNNTGLYIAGAFLDGTALQVNAGAVNFSGGGPNPNVLTLGSVGVEGRVKLLPATGAGSYTVRMPTIATDVSANLPPVSGTLIAETTPPVNSNDPGTTGMFARDSDYIYSCVSTDTWKRAALTTW